MSKHMLFLYAPTPCGKRTCSAFTEFCRTLESNLLLAASWCFENMDPHKQLGKVVESPGEMRIAFPVCFFWDATIPVIDCSCFTTWFLKNLKDTGLLDRRFHLAQHKIVILNQGTMSKRDQTNSPAGVQWGIFTETRLQFKPFHEGPKLISAIGNVDYH